MTLLESVVALVILGLAAVGLLELFQGSARGTRDAEAWVTAVAYAEESVEQLKAGLPPGVQDVRRAPTGFRKSVELRAWRNSMTDAVVTVTLPGGSQLVVHRLIPIKP
ncbi:MAG: type II secretion system protein [Gemmatimonadaceae bacterium]|nr:type II secretion system protein [Gemmatimonadaceae bacterium]MDQ3243039.1 type II secretion system GspH family protein [Gemmatimonadota bacterium]